VNDIILFQRRAANSRSRSTATFQPWWLTERVRFLRLPSWAPDVALGVIGGALGSCGTLLILHATARNWTASGAIATALGAFATFSAVLVALFPIWRSEERRKTAAIAVRVTALAQVTQLHGYLTACKLQGAVPKGERWFQHAPASKALDALLALMPRAEVLGRGELESLAGAIAACEAVRVNASVMPEDAKSIAEGLLRLV